MALLKKIRKRRIGEKPSIVIDDLATFGGEDDMQAAGDMGESIATMVQYLGNNQFRSIEGENVLNSRNGMYTPYLDAINLSSNGYAILPANTEVQMMTVSPGTQVVMANGIINQLQEGGIGGEAPAFMHHVDPLYSDEFSYESEEKEDFPEISEMKEIDNLIKFLGNNHFGMEIGWIGVDYFFPEGIKREVKYQVVNDGKYKIIGLIGENETHENMRFQVEKCHVCNSTTMTYRFLSVIYCATCWQKSLVKDMLSWRN